MLSARSLIATFIIVFSFSSVLFAQQIITENDIDLEPAARSPKIKFRDFDTDFFPQYVSMSFAVTVSSLDYTPVKSLTGDVSDYLDDIVVSNHGRFAPFVFKNSGGTFTKVQGVLPGSVSLDIHGCFVGDLDNDGYKDMLIAGGGADGEGAGKQNIVLENMYPSLGKLRFKDISDQNDAGSPKHRSRAFIPLPGKKGKYVDFLLVAKPREGYPNTMLRNISRKNQISLVNSDNLSLEYEMNSEGRADCFADIDNDGDLDFLILHNDKLLVFECDNQGEFSQFEDEEIVTYGFFNNFENGHSLQKIGHLEYFQLADINADGLLDIYLGRRPDNPFSDNYAYGLNGQTHAVQFYFLNMDEKNDFDEILFESESDSIEIDFLAKRGLSDNDASDIFLGKNNRNPTGRIATINAADCVGHNYGGPGIYIYHNGLKKGVRTWHVRTYWGSDEDDVSAGRVYINDLGDVSVANLERQKTENVEDLILINKGNNGKKLVFEISNKVRHNQLTRAGVWADFDNDGDMDFIGMRGTFQGDFNGDYFVLSQKKLDKNGWPKFKLIKKNGLDNNQDRVAQADCIAFGFFDDDGLLDLVTTTGWGLNPGNIGPVKVFKNVTTDKKNWTAVKLVGKRSNRDAIGAVVRLYDAKDNAITGVQMVGLNYNRMQNTGKLHFGLGDYEGELFAEIAWPSGVNQTVKISEKKVNVIVEKKE